MTTRKASKSHLPVDQVAPRLPLQQRLARATELAPILSAARKSSGFSQAALGSRAGLSQGRVSALEINPSSITLEQLLRLASSLDLELMLSRATVARQQLAMPSQLSSILPAARRRVGLTQAALGLRVALSQKRISAVELNPGALTLEQLLSIASILGMELILQTKGLDTPALEW